jgi:hypothetical protein
MIFPFFVGCDRSGTTLLRAMFDSHPDVAVPPESFFIPQFGRRRAVYEKSSGFDVELLMRDLYEEERFRRWQLSPPDVRRILQEPEVEDYPDAIRRLFQLFSGSKGKKRYADKTPKYISDVPFLSELFPESRFVHVIRDGRNVSLSIREDGRRNGPKRFTNIGEALLHWRTRVQGGLDAKQPLGPDRYLEVRFEDLLDDTESHVRRICEFIDVPFDESMFRYQERADELAGSFDDPYLQRHLRLPPTKGLRDWRTEMTRSEMAIAELLVGDLLDQLGYEPFPANMGALPVLIARCQKTALGVKSAGRKSRTAAKVWRRAITTRLRA